MGHPYPADSAFAVWANELAECLKQEFDVSVEVLGDGAVGNSSDLTDAVARGVVDAAIVPAQRLAPIWPQAAQIDTPGYILSVDGAERASNSPDLSKSLQASGIGHNIAMMGIGYTYSVLVGRDLDPVAIDGMKVRVSNAQQAEVLKNLGASVAILPVSEVFPAILYGAIDGAIVDSNLALSLAETGDVNAVSWGDGFKPFTTAHVAIVSDESLNVYGINRDDLTERCASTASVLTKASSANANALSAISPDTISADDWRIAIDKAAVNLDLDRELRDAIKSAAGTQ